MKGIHSQPPAHTSRLLVFLFTDLVGSTALKASLRTARFLPLLKRHDELLRQAISSVSDGIVQQDTGDGCFAIFNTASDAVRAALRFQSLMHCESWPAEARLSARTGIHLGEVADADVVQDGGIKVVGMPVDVAARVMSLAQGGQVLMTREAFNSARQFVEQLATESRLLDVQWRAHGPYQVKGSEDPLEIFEVGIEGISALSPPPDSEKARRYLRPGEEETLGWRPAVGQVMPNDKQWVLSGKLGEGGFGEVWLATHLKLKSHRVFKFCFDVERLRALKREVALFRLLKDALGERRDIAQVKGWQFDVSPYFIELDYAPAGNLSAWIKEQGGLASIPVSQRVHIVAMVCEALAAAHSVGVLHKDIKPSNILMAQDAEGTWYPRLADFGIGMLTDRTHLVAHNITPAGFTETALQLNDSSRTGTRMYAPPESLSARPHTVQGDIYSAGVLLYQMTVGDLERPLAGGWERHVEDELLRQDIAACTEGDPSQRPASASEVRDRLLELEQRRQRLMQQREEAQRQEAQRLTAARREQRRRRARAILVGTAFILMLGILGLLMVLRRERMLRDEADTQRTLASQREAQASAREREAKLSLAEAVTAQGLALGETHNQWDDTRSMLDRAQALYNECGAQSPDMLLAWNKYYEMSPPPLLRITGLPAKVRCLAMTGHTHLLAAGLDAHADNLRVYDIPSALRVSSANAPGGPVVCCALSFDGITLATASADGRIHLWSFPSLELMLEIKTHAGRKVLALGFMPDGLELVSLASDWRIAIMTRQRVRVRRMWLQGART